MTRHPWTTLSVAALVALAGCGSDGPSSASRRASSTQGTVAAATVPSAGSSASAISPATSSSGDATAGSATADTAAAVPTVAGSSSTVGTDAVPGWAQGFGRATITLAGRPLQVAVASTEAQREQGLRGVTSLAPFDGMLFVFDADGQVAFTMADTLIPLSIGFYDATGQPVAQLAMTPCTGTNATCPTYAAGHPFRYALETESGRLPDGPLHV